MNDSMSDAIRDLRKRLGMSQRAFGARTGMSQQNVWQLERGRHIVDPRMGKAMIELAREHGLTFGWGDLYDGIESTLVND